ncbi:MAG: DNA polymerase I [Deltaproteobacteria bacterium]|nr:DNA polymerase I [Deltaproteobacteria bacterium]
MKKHETVYLIDGSAYIYRAYHAIAPLSNSRGMPTHAVYGFTNILLRVIREKNPRYLAMAFDLRGPTFRHAIYDAYKANRPPMPEDLAIQIPYIKKISQAFNIRPLELEGFEADDLIASAATVLDAAGYSIIIVSGDKDLLQLVNDNIVLWDPMSDRVMDRDGVTAKYNVGPEKLNDLFALIGDSSDNVPGVPGVGPKTAEKLINDFGSLDSLYENVEQLPKNKLREKLVAHYDQAMLSRRLIALKSDLVVPQNIEDYRLPEPDQQQLYGLYRELEFSRLLKSEAPTSPMDTGGFHLVEDLQKLREVCRLLAKGDKLVLDTETTSLDPLSAALVGISLCTGSGSAWYVPVGHRNENGDLAPDQLPLAEVLACLRPLLEDPDLPKIGHNLKYDFQVLKQQGIELKGQLRDTMIASYLLDPTRRSHKLDDLAVEYLNLAMTSFAGVTAHDKRPDAFSFVALPAARDYSCEDVTATCLLWELFVPRLKELDLWHLFVELEMPLVVILAGMEEAGIRVDPALLAALADEFAGQLDRLNQKIFAMAGQEFNINSPRQLGGVLFEKLKLPMGRKTKTGYSTDVKVLEKLAAYHELPAAVLDHRTISKLKSTYIDKLATLIHPKTGRIHTSFNQTVAVTGRLSSSNPNLQNIPIRTPEGQRIREAFIASPGHYLLAADYSQIDLRVLAHYSQDKALLAAFVSGKDVHGQTAAEIFRVHPSLITPQMRRVAKSINFGIVYGMSAFGLSSQLNISRKEAQTFITRYFELYSGVKKFMEEIVEQARRDGFVTTIFHRRRILPDILSNDRTLREFAERTALNTPIQGTAADIIKLATIHADRLMREKRLRGRLLLQIHDELIFEVPRDELETTAALVREAMENVTALSVPLLVNLSWGLNLAETK